MTAPPRTPKTCLRPRSGLVSVTASTLLLCAAVWLTCARAEAQESDAERAEAFYIQATQLFNQGRYREALQSFDKAIEVQPDPVFYCNRSAVQVKLKEYRDALASLEICRSDYSPESPEEAAQIDTEYKALYVYVNIVEPGSRGVARNIATAVDPDDNNGEKVTPPVTGGEGDELLRYSAWGTGGLAALTLTTALVVDLLTQSDVDEFMRLGSEGSDRQAFDDLQATIEGRQVLIGTLLTVGVLSAASSAVLFWLYGESVPTAAPPLESPGAGLVPVEGGAVGTWRVPF